MTTTYLFFGHALFYTGKILKCIVQVYAFIFCTWNHVMKVLCLLWNVVSLVWHTDWVCPSGSRICKEDLGHVADCWKDHCQCLWRDKPKYRCPQRLLHPPQRSYWTTISLAGLSSPHPRTYPESYLNWIFRKHHWSRRNLLQGLLGSPWISVTSTCLPSQPSTMEMLLPFSSSWIIAWSRRMLNSYQDMTTKSSSNLLN